MSTTTTPDPKRTSTPPSLPPDVAELAYRILLESRGRSARHDVLAEEASAAAARLLVHLRLPAAFDPTDEAWDRAHDRLFRRYMRCRDALLRPDQAPRRSSAPNSNAADADKLARATQPLRDRPGTQPATPTEAPRPDQAEPLDDSSMRSLPSTSSIPSDPASAAPEHRSRQQRRRDERHRRHAEKQAARQSARPGRPTAVEARASPA